MIDTRGLLPQEWNGGHAGLPCSRRSYRRPAAKVVQTVERARYRFPFPELKGRPATSLGIDSAEGLVAVATPTWRTEPIRSQSAPAIDGRPGLEMVPFAGTQSMAYDTARARTAGLIESGALDKALRSRHATQLDDIVEILQQAVEQETKGHGNLFSFRQPYNPHRHVDKKTQTAEQKRRHILKALRSYPICDVYELARVPPDVWTCLSRDLGGISHGAVMRAALQYVQENFSRSERATFWTVVNQRQQSIDQGRKLFFPGDWDRFRNTF